MTRGARGGRGGMRRGGSRPPFTPRPAPRPTFDLALCDLAFPRVRPAPDDTEFTQALLKRHTELTPSPAEQAAVLNLVTKIETVVENLAVVPGDFAAFQLLTVRHVGAFKQGTMVKGDSAADLVFILKTLPTKEAVEGLSSKVTEELRTLLQQEGTAPKTEATPVKPDNKAIKQEAPAPVPEVKVSTNEGGFSVTVGDATVHVMVSTINQNLRKLKPEVHLSLDVLRAHSNAIGHTMWFEENAHHSSIKVLVRLLKDLCRRHSGLSPLKPWLLDSLAHYAIMNYPTRQPLPLNVAFRRVLQLLSSGFYLPGSMGAPGVRPPRGGPPHQALTPEELDRATMTAQTLLRVLSRGGHAYVLGLQEFEDGKDISCEITVWDGVVVSPLAPAYEPSDGKGESEDSLYAPMDEGDSDSPVPTGVTA